MINGAWLLFIFHAEIHDKQTIHEFLSIFVSQCKKFSKISTHFLTVLTKCVITQIEQRKRVRTTNNYKFFIKER